MDQDSKPSPVVYLRSKEGTDVPISIPAALHCELFRVAMGFDEDSMEDASDVHPTEPIDCQRFVAEILQIIVIFLEHYHQDPMADLTDPIKETYNDNLPQEFYREFVEKHIGDASNTDRFYAVRSAVNYLGIEPLMILTNLWLTFQIQGRSVAEIHALMRVRWMIVDWRSFFVFLFVVSHERVLCDCSLFYSEYCLDSSHDNLRRGTSSTRSSLDF